MNTLFLVVYGIVIIISAINVLSSHKNTNHDSLASLARAGWAGYGACMLYLFSELLIKVL
jgi:hypothetical protein